MSQAKLGQQIASGLLLYLTLAVLGWAAPGNPASADEALPSADNQLSLRLTSLQAISSSSGEAGKVGTTYPLMAKLLGLPSQGAALLAFEENRTFVYAAGSFPVGAQGTRWIRRVIFLKPSVFIVDDEILSHDSPGPYRARFYLGSSKALIQGAKAKIRAGERTIILQTLFPAGVRIQALTAAPLSEPSLEVTSRTAQRFLHMVCLDANALGPDTPLKVMKDRLEVMIEQRSMRFHLTRPIAAAGAGDISVTNAAGKAMVSRRPFPSGIMPHSSEGVRLLETWDGDYRGGKHPKWDTGQPSADLVKAIDEGVFKPGRVIEFGSGTGTDSIYMASKGFDVTAIDISPSAVAQALEKARAAGVKVRFMLADALNPPEIGKFDYIYDRACYHEVRGQNLDAYLETLKKVSRPGTRLLLLAGNSNGPDLGFGPPTVSEEELRFDFTPLFDIEWLKESRFEVIPPDAGFPLAWSVLMKRKAD